MSFFSFWTLFVCLLSLSLSNAQRLQFSHQSPYLFEYGVDLVVNGHLVPTFVNVTYGEISDYVDLSSYVADSDPSVFNFTIQETESGASIASELRTISENDAALYVADALNGETDVDILFSSVALEQPEEFYVGFRFINLAPTANEKLLWVNGEVDSDPVTWGILSSFSELREGSYTFQILDAESRQSLVSSTISISSGEILTLIFNGEGDLAIPYTLEAHIDADFGSNYTDCLVRFVNAVSDYSEATIVLDPNSGSVVEIERGTASEYQSVPIGDYLVFFSVSEENVAEVEFQCESSKGYTITFQGGSEVDVTGTVLEDQTSKPFYDEAQVRVDLLAFFGSEDPSFVISVNGVEVTTATYANPTEYIQVNSTSPEISVSQGELVIYQQTLEVKLGESFSWYVFGDSESETYPIQGLVVADSEAVVPPEPTTTGSTTESSTTGESTTGGITTTSGATTTGETTTDDDEDDEDDDLSGGAIAGIVIAVLISVGVLIGVVVWFTRRRGYSQA